MPIKRFNNQTFQYRQAVRRVRNISGLGVIYRSNRSSTNKQILRKLQDREARQIAAIQATPTIIPAYSNEQVNAYNRLFEGTGSFDDFRKTKEYNELISKYGTDRGFDAAQVTYYDVLLGSGKLTAKQVEDINRKRNSVLRDFYKKTKMVDKSNLSRGDRIAIQQQSKAMKEYREQANRAGFTTERKYTNQVLQAFKKPGGFSTMFGYPGTPLYVDPAKAFPTIPGMSTNAGPRLLSISGLFSSNKKKGK